MKHFDGVKAVDGWLLKLCIRSAHFDYIPE